MNDGGDEEVAGGCPFSIQSSAALAKLKAELRRLAAHAAATLKDALGDLPDRSPRAKRAKHIANADNVKFSLTQSGELLVGKRKAQA
jgi:hypothetical protein